MNKYIVGVSRNHYHVFEIIAENEEQAENKADELFDMLQLYGSELYNDYNGNIELVEENVKVEDEEV